VAQTGGREADLKAAFIYNFTKYIAWDSSSVEDAFVIGVIGPSPVTASLGEIATTNRVKNKRIIIRTYSKPEEIGPCHVLFIPRHCPYLLQSILEHTGKGVLTISEETGYARLGTALNFIIVNDKLKFEANLRAIYSAGLSAGSQLLKLAVIID
jgi:hypothetical protein